MALANKECLVCAGDLFMQRVQQTGATLIPVDSEHNAIFQVFDFEHPETVSHITLTASGGPFRTMPMEQMRHVSPEEALRHPNWDMGDKITIDSATMMNKGLEMIEAYHLFPVTPEQIRVLVHPQSVIHSLVSYIDGSTLAQMGQPDMRTPIAYAMAWPERMPAPAAELDLSAIGTLTFEAPDEMRFPALRLAREALQSGGAAPTILNAANEVAVAKFLSGEIGFLQIADSVEQVLNQMTSFKINSLEDVFEADSEAREKVLSLNGLRSKGALGT